LFSSPASAQTCIDINSASLTEILAGFTVFWSCWAAIVLWRSRGTIPAHLR
jgi:hypothetical protein